MVKSIFLSCLFVTFILTGCNKAITQEEYDSMVEEKDQKIEELESQVQKLQDHIETLEAKTQEVNNQFERFQNENWRDVVPDAESSLNDLNSEIENDPNYSTY